MLTGVCMKLQNKILGPIIAIITVGIIILGILTMNSVYNGLTIGLIKSQMSSQLDNLVENVKSREAVVDLVFSTVNEKNLDLTKSVAELIKSDPTAMETPRMIALAKSIGVDEIHVINNNGVLTQGSVADFFGFDFNTTDQTKPFISLIDQKDGRLAQEPSQRGTDNALFQYIGVSRLDEPGVVQIGLEPSYLVELQRVIGVQNVFENYKVGKSGYAYVVDESGITLYHKNPENVGIDIHDMPELQPILDGNKDFFSYKFEGKTIYASVKKVDGISYVATMPREDFLQDIYDIALTMLIVFVLAILVIVVVSAIIARNVFRPIPLMVESMKRAGQGDLSVRMVVKSKDELSVLSASFNQMVINVGELIGNAKNVSLELIQSAHNLAVSAEETSASTEEVAKTVGEIAIGASDQARDAENAAGLALGFDEKLNLLNRNSKEISESAFNVEEVNKNGSRFLGELKTATSENIKSSREIANAVKSLEEKSKNIGSILQTISSIADQTNLLALNASIEAARAGEHGRGFAVVAEEIRKLAEESSGSASKISEIVNLIQSETGNAVSIVNEVSKNADIQSNSVENMNVSFTDISSAIGTITGQIKEVDLFIKEILGDKDNIVTAISNISAVSEQTAASSEQVSATTQQQTMAVESIAASADQLKELADALNQHIDRFRL